MCKVPMLKACTDHCDGFVSQEMCKVPKLIVEGVTCDDLNPGELGNTWFVTACASLAQEKKVWQKVGTPSDGRCVCVCVCVCVRERERERECVCL